MHVARKADHAAEKLKRDNDWTSKQVAQFPDRLVGFCGLNPLKDDALEELARCAADPNLRRGLKLHFGNSVVDYHNPEHIARVHDASGRDYEIELSVDETEQPTTLAEHFIIAGEPNEVADRFALVHQQLGVGHLLLEAQESKMDHPTTMRSIENPYRSAP